MPVCTYMLLHVACVYPVSVFSNVCALKYALVCSHVCLGVRIHRVGTMDLRVYAFLCTSHMNMCSMCKSCAYLYASTSAYYYLSVILNIYVCKLFVHICIPVCSQASIYVHM